MSDPFEIGDLKQLYSGSSLNTFLRCGTQWEFAYVYGYKRPPKLRTTIGIAAHSAVETNYAQKVETGTDLPTDDVLDAFSDSFDRLAADIEEDPDETLAQGKDSGIATVFAYQKTVAPAVQPVMVEQPVQFSVNDIPYVGTIDLVDSERRVRDLKTVKRKPGNERNDYVLSMTGYALGYRHATGLHESEIVLDYMVRTQKPYYHPVVSEGPVTDAAIDAFAGILRIVNEAVKTGTFLPTGLTNAACSWCGYNDICPWYARAKLR